MNGGELLLTISINCLVIYILHVLHKRSIAKTLQHLRKEVNELENLVAAIIEEFEEVAERVWPDDAEVPPVDSSVQPQADEEKTDKADSLGYIGLADIIEEEPWVVESAESGSLEILKAKESETPENGEIYQPQELIDPRHQKIMQLWKEGLAVEEIAKQLGTGRGEVQLVLGIYKRS